MSSQQKSIDDVRAWLKTQRDRGDINETTGRLRITAIDQIIAVLAAGEDRSAEGVLANLDNLGRRWINKGLGKPDTIKDYLSRIRGAVNDYLRFQEDPLTYKPARAGVRTTKSARPVDSENEGAGTAQSKLAQEFKIPRSSYDELCKIIRAYAHAGPDATLSELSSICGMGNTQISKNSGFLVSAGLVSEGRTKGATALGRRLGSALEHDLPTEVASAWREVVQQSEFLRRMVAAVRIRKGMDMADLQGHIAYSAGVPKTPENMAGAKTIANILVISGLVIEQDGKLNAVQAVASQNTHEVGGPALPTSVIGSSPNGATNIAAPTTGFSAVPGVAVKININITATPSELKELGPALRHLLAEMRKATSDELGPEVSVAAPSADTAELLANENAPEPAGSAESAQDEQT